MEFSILVHGCGNIGTGHLFRGIYISDWITTIFKKRFSINFLVLDSDEGNVNDSVNLLKTRSKFKISPVSEKELKKSKYEFLIVDILNPPKNLMDSLRLISKRILIFDCTNDARCLSDISVNPLYYNISSCCRPIQTFVGPQFNINSPKIFSYKTKFNSTVKNILLTQGGSDPYNFTIEILNALESTLRSYKNVTFHVLLGPDYKHPISVLDKFNLRFSNLEIHNNLKSPLELFIKMDLAISSVGLTSIELACLRIPCIHLTKIDKEIETAKLMEQIGVSMYFDNSKVTEKGYMHEVLSEIIEEDSKRKEMVNSCHAYFSEERVRSSIKSFLS